MEKNLSVGLIGHTQLSEEFKDSLDGDIRDGLTDGQAIALTAIRTCYSSQNPWEIVENEYDRYFKRKATDGGEGTEADRLYRQIITSKHTSTMEHIGFVFSIDGVSRSLMAQLTRTRVGVGFSVQSQRYVRLGSGDKSNGFDYVVPKSIKVNEEALSVFERAMQDDQEAYDDLRALKIPAEDARAVLPNATSTAMTFTINVTALLALYYKRKEGNGAQLEIAKLVERLKDIVVEHEPWLKQFFD